MIMVDYVNVLEYNICKYWFFLYDWLL